MTTTPAQIETWLMQLSDELNVAHDNCVEAENLYATAKGEAEMRLAKSRIYIGKQAAADGRKLTVQEKEDEALVMCKDEVKDLYTAEAVVKAARANVQRVRAQIDIARSVSASVRTSLDMT